MKGKVLIKLLRECNSSGSRTSDVGLILVVAHIYTAAVIYEEATFISMPRVMFRDVETKRLKPLTMQLLLIWPLKI